MKLLTLLFKKVINNKITEIRNSKKVVNYSKGSVINANQICRNTKKDYAIKKLKELL